MSKVACNGCIKKAEGTDQDPKSFCRCNKFGEVGNFGDSAFTQLKRRLESVPLPITRDEDKKEEIKSE